LKSESGIYSRGYRSFWSTATQRSMMFGWITLGLMLFLTFFLWYEVRNSEIEESRERFDIYTREARNAIIKRISTYEQVLKGGRGLFMVSDSVTRDEFRTYINNIEIEKNYPGILGIGYTVVIPESQLKRHEDMVRAEGFPDYKVWPEFKRDIYTSIVYLEPFEGRNLRAFGYDMMSEETRRNAMELARDSARTTVSDKVILVQETSQDIQAGFLMYLPFYRPGSDISTVEGRRDALVGFIYSPFRMNDLLSGILSETQRDINLEIYDNEISYDRLMYVSSPDYLSLEGTYNSMFTSEGVLPLNDNEWIVRFTTMSAFDDQVIDERPVLILIVGLLTSALIFVLVISLATNNFLFRELNQLIESTGEGIFGIDNKKRCTFINSSASRILGGMPEDFYNKNMHDLIHYQHEDGTPYTSEDSPITAAFLSGEVKRVENEVFWRLDGTCFPVEYSASPIITKGEIKGVVITFSDITDRKETFAQLSNSLQEKVVLLKEVHHRVKNNLQIISSLLNLQSQYVREENAHEIFKESQNRIRSMALIHEKLYQTSSMSRLNIAGYVHELVMNLLHSYDTTGKINFRMDVEDVLLNIDTAITLGLSINEIVSNSLKHAFSAHSQGEIYISLKELDKDNFSLIISDNGKGLPEHVDFRNTSSLGLQLVNTLIEQLEGTIELENDNGTRFIITFSAPSEKENVTITN
jgi:PAS domain S-box-containing protein